MDVIMYGIVLALALGFFMVSRVFDNKFFAFLAGAVFVLLGLYSMGGISYSQIANVTCSNCTTLYSYSTVNLTANGTSPTETLRLDNTTRSSWVEAMNFKTVQYDLPEMLRQGLGIILIITGLYTLMTLASEFAFASKKRQEQGGELDD